MIKLSDFVIQFVANQGVKHVFLLPGGGCMHLVDSLGKCKEIEYVCNLHEQAAAIAADAYGQYTNNLGVALVTTGPGGTNTVTGVAAAWMDSTPCLFISGQVKRADMIGNRGVRQMGFQEIDIVSIVKPITKYAVTITDPDSIKYHIEKAVYLAKNGRPGPVWVDIPLDVQATVTNEEELHGYEIKVEKFSADKGPLKSHVARTIELLKQSERPVVLVGNGVRLTNGLKEFLRLIEILKAPVLTTWKAIDFLPESHWLYAGRPGAAGQRGANFTLQNSDLVLAIGARLDFGQTGYNHHNFARMAKKIVVDCDRAELDKLMMPIDVPVCDDAKTFIEELIKQSKNTLNKQHIEWLNTCKAWQAQYPVLLPEYLDKKYIVNDYVLIDILSEEMSGDDLLVPGSSGACSERTMQAFKVKEGMRIFNSEGLGPMGFGIPASIGGCIASGRRRTICIDGDGGFAMNIQELETVKRLDLPIKFFVLNNKGYASIMATQRNYFNGRYVGSNIQSGLTLPDITALSKAFAIRIARIEDHTNIRQQVRQVLESEGPFICEVMVSPYQDTAPRISSKQNPDGSMESMPMEDLWPLLNRKEFHANMIIPPR